MRTMNRQDFIVLEAVESGMKNHALVPLKIISSIANLRHGGTMKIISSLLRDKLLSHENTCGYDGYRLTNSGYDILALHALKVRKQIAALGNRIGTGKESDVYVAATPEGTQVVLKFHRLGRTSFRNVKNKRDYFQVNATTNNRRNPSNKQQPNSWLFLSRISALKEFSFMKALYDVDYPTPTPLMHNRHVVCMSLLRGMPLYQLHKSQLSEEQALSIFQQSMELTKRLAQHGLVHCDLNEFNLLVDLSGIQNVDNHESDPYVRHSGASVTTKGALSVPTHVHQHVDGTGEYVTEELPTPTEFLDNGQPKPVVKLIDFPQMVSTKHPNAQELFERDLQCLQRYFLKKLKCIVDDDMIPKWSDVVVESEDSDALSTRQVRLDEELQASGFSEMDANRDLELYYFEKEQEKVAMGEEEGDEEYEHDVGDCDSDADEQGVHDDAVELANDSESDSVSSDRNEEERQEIDLSLLEAQSRAVAEEKARARVRRQIEEEKRKRSQKGAFRSRNSNKTYVKGKRVMNDIGY